MSGRREKDASIQALFREVNEQIEQLNETFGTDGEESFVCECGNPECTQAIALPRSEYERIRGHANRFAIALNHEDPEVERLVEENERYAVVEVYAGEGSEIARDTDPRSQANTRGERERPDERAGEGTA